MFLEGNLKKTKHPHGKKRNKKKKSEKRERKTTHAAIKLKKGVDDLRGETDDGGARRLAPQA